MRIARGIFLLGLTMVSLASADTVVSDPFNGSHCSSPACDVIGDRMLFDIQSASAVLNGNVMTAKVAFNTKYSDLKPFTISTLKLDVGDLFFYNPANPYNPSTPSTLNVMYGLPLYDHGVFDAGSLYKIDGSSGNTALNAQQTLASRNAGFNPAYWIFRNFEYVWLGGAGNAVAGTPVTENIASLGNGISDAKYLVTMSFTVPSGFLSDLVHDGEIGIAFASASCGNDVLRGVAEVPEPSFIVLIAAGMVGAAFVHLRRRASA